MIYDNLLEITSRQYENMSDDELNKAKKKEAEEAKRKEQEKARIEAQRRQDEIDKENKEQYSRSVDYLDTDYDYTDQRKSEVDLDESIKLFESEWKSFNQIFSAFNVLTENGIIMEKVSIKEIGKKIMDAIRWLRDKLKEILAIVKEKIRTFIMDDDDFNYNWSQIWKVYRKIHDEHHQRYKNGIDDKDIDINPKDYMFDIKLHHKNIKVLPLYYTNRYDDYYETGRISKHDNKRAKQLDLFEGREKYKVYEIEYKGKHYSFDDKIIWFVDLYGELQGPPKLRKEFTLKSDEKEQEELRQLRSYSWYKEKTDENSDHIQQLRKNVETTKIVAVERSLSVEINPDSISDYDLFRPYELSEYEKVDKQMNIYINNLEKEYKEIISEGESDTDDSDYMNRARLLIQDINYLKELQSLNNRMIKIYMDCNHKNAMECWKLIFKFVKPVNPSLVAKELKLKKETNK